MTVATNLGFPRMGPNRNLKKLVESYWSSKITSETLFKNANQIKAQHWYLQQTAGIANGHIPSNDFSFYDHVLDHTFMFGAIPEIYKGIEKPIDRYFAMGRGLQKGDVDVPACEMKKWFDTNYHSNVVGLDENTAFVLTPIVGDKVKPVQEFIDALEIGIKTRPVLLGPISYLLLQKKSKSASSDFDILSLLPTLLPIYQKILAQLTTAGAEWIQFDEPTLVLDQPQSVLQELTKVYTTLHQSSPSLKFILATYFETLPSAVRKTLLALPIDAIHLDLVRVGAGQLDDVLAEINRDMKLSLGVVDGRNIWKSDLGKQLKVVQKAVDALGLGRVFVAPSCSLLHVPHSLKAERKMKADIKDWLSFATEKLDEIVTISIGAKLGIEKVSGAFESNAASINRRSTSTLIHDSKVQQELKDITPNFMKRADKFDVRIKAQQEKLNLPLFPTTTIGSFPQTKDVRVARQRFKKGESKQDEYDEFIANEIAMTVKKQEEIGLDVLVHGESERNDMVEYFGENLEGFVFSENGWVQSYGSRCVKPPIIFGDVSRPKPMTVKWSSYAKSLTSKPMKGMLTGPVTILQWSFVRDDQPRNLTSYQIALALRKEVVDLEAADISVIQIDEPAIREGLPLRKADQAAWLEWAVNAFLISSTGVRNETQIHTHMCYSDFNEIIDSIKRMDADCVTIEHSKSDLKLLDALEIHGYSNAIGPGLYDVHSQRVPSVAEMEERFASLISLVGKNLLWVNPDCGLKTRGWKETEEQLRNMVAVADHFRKEF